MAAKSQPSITPPRPPGHGALIALLVLALVIAGAALALYYGVRVLSRGVSIREEQAVNGNKQLTTKTPAGRINVNEGVQVDPALLGLPLYPGARRVEGVKESARVNLELPGGEIVGVVTARFETPVPIGSVKRYYHDRLSGRITNVTHARFGETIVLEITRDNQERVVALKRLGTGTEITLVRVRHSASEAN